MEQRCRSQIHSALFNFSHGCEFEPHVALVCDFATGDAVGPDHDCVKAEYLSSPKVQVFDVQEFESELFSLKRVLPVSGRLQAYHDAS